MSQRKKTISKLEDSSDGDEKVKVLSKKKTAIAKKKPVKKSASSDDEIPSSSQRKIKKKIITKSNDRQIKKPFLLPSDLFFHLIDFVEIEDVLSLSRANKYYHSQLVDSLLWKKLAKIKANISYELFEKEVQRIRNPIICCLVLCFREAGIIINGVEDFIPGDKFQKVIGEKCSKEKILSVVDPKECKNIIFGIAKSGRVQLLKELNYYPISLDDENLEPVIDGFASGGRLSELTILLTKFNHYQTLGETPFYSCLTYRRVDIFTYLYNLYFPTGNLYLRDHIPDLYKTAFLRSLFPICDLLSVEFLCQPDILLEKPTKEQFDYALAKIQEKRKLLLMFILNDIFDGPFIDEIIIKIGFVPIDELINDSLILSNPKPLQFLLKRKSIEVSDIHVNFQDICNHEKPALRHFLASILHPTIPACLFSLSDELTLAECKILVLPYLRGKTGKLSRVKVSEFRERYRDVPKEFLDVVLPC